jgi:excisionase family DNA binding protein
MLTIGEMARKLGVSVPTLRRWDKEGRLLPTSRTLGNHRRYAVAEAPKLTRKTILYARVSSHDQKADLERQKDRLIGHAERQGWEQVEVIADLGSGMNCRKTGLLKLLGHVLRGDADRIVVENKDRLLRFGSELVVWLCAMRGCSLVIVDDDRKRSPEETLARDVLEVITVFSSRLYGARSAARRTKITTEAIVQA